MSSGSAGRKGDKSIGAGKLDLFWIQMQNNEEERKGISDETKNNLENAKYVKDKRKMEEENPMILNENSIKSSVKNG